jgi:hypothetical protein
MQRCFTTPWRPGTRFPDGQAATGSAGSGRVALWMDDHRRELGSHGYVAKWAAAWRFSKRGMASP